MSAIARTHINVQAQSLTIDAIYPEAWLHAAIGDTLRALRVIAPVLDAIRLVPVRELSDIGKAATLVPAMLLRSELEFARGDHRVGTRWVNAALALTNKWDTGGRIALAEKLLNSRAMTSR